MNKITLSFLCLIFLFSCKREQSKAQTISKHDTEELIIDTLSPKKISLNDFHIFDMYSIENKGNYNMFISLSDIYTDSLSIPPEIIENQKNLSFDELKHFELPPVYREKMLKGTRLSENDTLYLYDYKKNRLEKFPVNTLKAVANLNLYTSEGEEIFEYYYMLGFQLNKLETEENAMDKSNYGIAYFGKENPFTKKALIPVKWKKIPTIKYPLKQAGINNLGNTYYFKNEDLQYYLQDFKVGNEVFKRQLVIVKNNKITLIKNLEKGEGAEFTPLLPVEKSEFEDGQWTGKLFKDKPPVIFGFVSESFGCPGITFLDNSYPGIYMNCDNRH